MVKKLTEDDFYCPLKKICTKWSFLIIEAFTNYESLSYGQIMNIFKKLDHITSKALSYNLKLLTEAKILKRKIIKASPPKVVYSITNFGKQLNKNYQELHSWFRSSIIY